MAKKFGYTMYASGYGSKTYHHSSKEKAKDAMSKDAADTAADYDGEIQDFGDEIVVVARNGDEIARFELLS